MLKVDLALNHIPAGREHVVTLYESVNQPLVNIPSHGTAPTAGYMLGTRNDRGYFTVFVYLRQGETNATVIYVSEPRNLSPEQYRIEEGEALRFLESMGFVMDNLGFRDLERGRQDDLIRRVPIFRPPRSSLPTLELMDVAEDADVEEVAPRRTPAPPARGPDAMFGGLGIERQDVLRRSGRSAGQAPPAGAVGPIRKVVGSGTPGGATGSGAPAAAGGLVSAAPTNAGPSPATGRPAPAPAEEGLPADPEALARLGKLLSTFAVLAALAIPAEGCRTPGPVVEEPLSASVQTQIDIANQQLSQGYWAEAISTLTPVLEEAPNAKEARYAVGLGYMNLGKNTEAETHLRRALITDPSWSMAKNSLATVLIAERRCEEAAQLLSQVLEDIFYQTPEFAEHNLARAEACLGRRADAVRRLERLLVKRPQFCLGYLTLADMSSQEQQPALTIQSCDSFESQCAEHEEIKNFISPENSCLCYLRKGLAHAQLGEVEAARQSFSSCRSEGAFGKECRRSLELLPP